MFECPHCQFKMVSERGLKVHEPYCDKNPNRKHCACRVCGETFAKPQLVAAHARYAHPNGKPTAKPVARKQRKQNKSRRSRVGEPVLSPSGAQLHFCPNCGTNLGLIGAALRAVGGLQ
jgi:hypothetical protein